MTRIVEDDSREDEIEQNINDASRAVFNLNQMALDMGTELNRQNIQLGNIQHKAGINENRIGRVQNRAMKRLDN